MSIERSILRLEAALYEVGRTITYPAMPDPTAAILAAVAEREARRAWPAVRVGRPLLVAILIVLVLAGVVAAAYLISTTWLSTGPRGVQFSDEFAFAEVYRDGGLPVDPGPLPQSVYYADFAISHDGSAIYAVRMPSYPERAATLVRLTGLDAPTLQREDVVDYAELTDPALWDAGLDALAVDIGILLFNSDDDTFAVAPDGQIFLAAAAYGRHRIPLPYAEEQEAELRANWPDLTDAEIEQITTRQPILSAALIVVRPDGSRQKVLTIGELVDAGLLATDGAEASIAVAASDVDRLWIKSSPFGDTSAPPALFQVIDPDHDGDWSNRTILPLALPESIPQPAAIPRPGDDPGPSWYYQQPTAEVSSSSVDRSRSVLLPMLSTTGEYRIYRVRDTNADGDARDASESELVLSGQPGFGDAKWPTVTSRVVVDGGNEVLRELLVSSLTRSTRLSRVLEDGSVRDIARAIAFGPEDVVAEPDGDIDVVVQGPADADSASTFTIYRLIPVPVGEERGTASAVEESPSPASSAGGLETLTPGEPRIAYTLETYGEEETAQIMVVGADGSGPTELIRGEHNSDFCQSADGSLIGFWSDEEVPHEPFVHVANADGTGRRKISEDVGAFWCGFSGDAILVKGRAETAPIVRHDLATGEETELLSGADRLEASPDGRRYLAAIRGAGGATLEVLDATSGDRRALDGPLPENRTFTSFAWAPDGALVAYAIGPAPTSQGPQTGGPHEIYVADPAGGEPRLMYSLDGYEPRLSMSADARHLLVWAPSPDAADQGPLVLVEVETGEARTLAEDAVFGDWHPSEPTTFAYATPEALYIATTGGEAREILRVPPEGICPDCETGGAPQGEWGWGDWMGWSPDGRYIGLPDFAPVLAVIKVETTELQILTGDVADEAFIFGARWLR